MKNKFYVILPLLLVVTVFASSTTPSFGITTMNSFTCLGGDPPPTAPVHVWFDSTPEMADPSNVWVYIFNVDARTSYGHSITCMHWDFGDGSTLDIPWSAQSYVSELRYHQYAQVGTYNVAVTAYNEVGNSGTAQVSVTWNSPPPP